MRARRSPDPALQMMAVRRLATASPAAASMRPNNARDDGRLPELLPPGCSALGSRNGSSSKSASGR